MATATSRASRFPNWIGAVAPLALVALLIGVFLVLEPISSLNEPPPVEAGAIERTVLSEDSISLRVRNDGPDTITIAQVLVNDAYRPFEIGDNELGRLEATKVDIPYPWEEGLPLHVVLLTRTGVPIEHEIEAATATPEVDGRAIGIYALLGLYIGVIPVAIGLLWFPALKRASANWIAFFLAFTIGLLAFLLIDTIAEGLELSAETGAALDGVGLFGIGALGAILVLTAVGNALSSRRAGALTLAYFVAIGIGLHNLGEGLAVGAAVAAGEVALGTFLVLGFALHNTTEGLAIVAPLGRERERPSLKHFVAFGLVAGLPTVAGAWLGGFAFHPGFASLFFGIAAGAIAQVIWTVAHGMPRTASLATPVGAAGAVAGLVLMYLTGLFTA
jgi:zinc transporter, ZIP family